MSAPRRSRKPVRNRAPVGRAASTYEGPSMNFSAMGDQALWDEAGTIVAPAMPPAVTPRSPLQQRRRRGFDPSVDDGREAVALVRDDGVLRWVYEPPQSTLRGMRRAWRAHGGDRRDVVKRLEYPPLGRNQITSKLQELDLKLNPARGMHRWDNGGWKPINQAELALLRGRVLLLLHGTFSKSKMYDSELGATPDGRRLFERLTTASKPYASVLAFDHATLSVAPWLNAIALKERLGELPRKTTIDVVCHSRGGLVLCWTLKIGPELPIKQVVFVGSPLTGTSLAAPDKLRQAIDFLSNLADAVSVASKGVAVALPPAAPIAIGVSGLAAALGRVLNLGGALPLADAAVGLVPGLMSQSRVDNNLELDSLFPLQHLASLAAIGGTFRPDESRQPIWKFWRRFTNIGDQLKYAGADVIFQQPNDLIVDTVSMKALGRGTMGITDWRNLGETATTHHCNYFRDAEVLRFLDERLK